MLSSKQARPGRPPLHVLLLLCWAVRQGLCDAASEAGSVSRTPFGYHGKNKQLHVDREMALRVINHNLDRAPGSIKEKAEVPPPIPCPTHDVHQRLPAWAARSYPAPLPTLRSSLADGCSFPPNQRSCPPVLCSRPLARCVRTASETSRGRRVSPGVSSALRARFLPRRGSRPLCSSPWAHACARESVCTMALTR